MHQMSLERAMAKVLECNFWAKDFLRKFFKTQMFDECFHTIKKQKHEKETKKMLFQSMIMVKQGIFNRSKRKGTN